MESATMCISTANLTVLNWILIPRHGHTPSHLQAPSSDSAPVSVKSCVTLPDAWAKALELSLATPHPHLLAELIGVRPGKGPLRSLLEYRKSSKWPPCLGPPHPSSSLSRQQSE